jgi:predicted nucleic acid-binding protein
MRDGKVFIDTNILVHAYDVSAWAKHRDAVAIMSDLWNTARGVTSMQVLQGFFANATGKIPKPLNVTTAREVVRDLLKWNPVLINGEIIVDAIDIHAAHKYTFWDSLLIASAIESGAGTLLTEDLSDKHKIKNIVIRNPFKQQR